jgi:hypothetical protein
MDALSKRLKDISFRAFISFEQRQFRNTGNPHHAWHTWQVVRRNKVAIPSWVAAFIDTVAAREVTVRTKATDTAERYHAALTAMTVAVDRHNNRLRIREAAKQLGQPLMISRRDKPNLTAIARDVAKAHGVSINRLLAQYRKAK